VDENNPILNEYPMRAPKKLSIDEGFLLYTDIYSIRIHSTLKAAIAPARACEI
jgi:hypothetical protein